VPRARPRADLGHLRGAALAPGRDALGLLGRGRPAIDPAYGVDLQAWWIDPDKAATIDQRAKGVVE
jgi:hypothetical protein